MCGGMTYKYPNPETQQLETRRVFFPYPHAQVPVLSEDGEILLHQWGKRSKEEDPAYDVPVTGWARIEKLADSYWQRFEPTKVLIPALKFCEKPAGFEKSLWYPPLQPQNFLMGLMLPKADKSFIYVVTRPPEKIFRDIDRVPVIVDMDFNIQEPLELELQGQMNLF